MVNSSVRTIYILRPNRDQLRQMQLQGLRLGIEPTTSDRQTRRHIESYICRQFDPMLTNKKNIF